MPSAGFLGGEVTPIETRRYIQASFQGSDGQKGPQRLDYARNCGGISHYLSIGREFKRAQRRYYEPNPENGRERSDGSASTRAIRFWLAEFEFLPTYRQ